jgi:SAM-dependent methyltransferase
MRIGSHFWSPRKKPHFKRRRLAEIKAQRPYYISQEIPLGENAHLGGYVNESEIGDPATYHPNLWAWAVKLFGITSVIDIGCGEGHSTAYFRQLGCDVLGVEGYGPAVANSRAPGKVIQHDYTSGPYIPARSFDMAWSCEFVEHVEEKHLPNFMVTFDKASIIFMTFAVPGQGGHHHVNEQPQEYWLDKFHKLGFSLDKDATECARIIARADQYLISPDYPSHFASRGLVLVRG